MPDFFRHGVSVFANTLPHSLPDLMFSRVIKTSSSLLVFVLILLLSPTRALGQTDFRAGYIVQLSGDTLRGEVDYRGALRSTYICQFRLAPGAPVLAYRPQELRGYGFPGQKEYRTRLTPLPDSMDRSQFPRRFFLEILVSGPASLYARSDPTHYYLQKGAGSAPVTELLFQRRVVESDSRSVLQELTPFRGVLSEAFADCPAILPSISQTPFRASALIAIVQRYNQCKQPAAPILVSKRTSHLGVGVLAGGQVSQIVFTGSSDQVGSNFIAKPAPVLGLGVYFTGPSLNEHLMLRLEALYAPQEYEDEYPVASSYAQASAQGHYRISYLRVPFLVRYTGPAKHFHPVLEAGLSVNTALHVESEQRVRYVTSL